MNNKWSKVLWMPVGFSLLLAGCSSSGFDLTDYAGQTLTGMVTAVDGSLIALSLGEYDPDAVMEMPGTPNGGPFEMSDPQSSDPGWDMDEGQMGFSGENMQEALQRPDGMPSDIPDMPASDDKVEESMMDMQIDTEEGNFDSQDSTTSSESRNELAAARDTLQMQPDQNMNFNAGGMPGMMGFTASEETAIISIKDATIQSEDGSEASLAVGDVVTVEMGSDNKAKTVEILSGISSSSSFGSQSGTDSKTSANTIDADGDYSNETYTSDGSDENALLIEDASVTLTNITVDKSGGSSSNTESGDFYGVNAALLAENNAQVVISDSTITSNAQNGNGIFCYGKGTSVTISNTSITTKQDNSGGIMTTGGGTMNAENLTVSTAGDSAAAIRTDRGGGSVVVSQGSYTTDGYNSPAVYSTADITVKNAELSAENSEALVIEGENSITLEDCSISSNMSDDKGSSSQENVHGVMVYQSMSGDADEGTSLLSITGGSLLCKNGDVFYFTNTAAKFTLSGVEITNEDQDSCLMRIAGNSSSHGWGTAGANGANVECIAQGQKLDGDIVVDTISTLSLTLKNNSSLNGSVNIIDNAQNGTAVDNNAVVHIENGSSWSLTADCTISSLENEGTIHYNGFTITLADGTVLSE